MANNGFIGIDIGGTKILFALLDKNYNVVLDIKIKTNATEGRGHFAENLERAIKTLLSGANKKKLAIGAVGVGCCGTVDNKKGSIKLCPHIPFLEGYPLRDHLTKWTKAPVFTANDAHAGLYGEQQLGSAIGQEDVIGIFVGTGIGGAIILNGVLHIGAGHAGNIGHYSLHSLGLADAEHGTINDVASRPALVLAAVTLAYKQRAPQFLKKNGTDISKITSADVALAIQQGDKRIEQMVRARFRLMGAAISNFVDFLNPEMVVLGGGVVEAMPTLIRREVELGIRQNTSPEAYKGLKVVVAQLKNHAVTIGAAKLAVDNLFSRTRDKGSAYP